MPANGRWDLIRRLKVNLAEDKFAEDYCHLGLTLFDIRKWASEFLNSVLLV